VLFMSMALRRLSLWLSVPTVFGLLTVLVIFAALLQLAEAEMRAKAGYRRLERQVPAGCTGAVRRVLSSSHLYEVPLLPPFCPASAPPVTLPLHRCNVCVLKELRCAFYILLNTQPVLCQAFCSCDLLCSALLALRCYNKSVEPVNLKTPII
jgi:hypothetical protein